MNNKKFSGEVDSMLNQAAAISGGSREGLDKLIGENPQVAKLLSRMTPDDVRRLQQIINDPQKARSILATPQAQSLISSLKNGGKPSMG